VKELLTEIGYEALEPPADRCFVDMKDTGDLEKCLAIKEVGGKQKSVLRWQGREG
jgi:hypothetical protein